MYLGLLREFEVIHPQLSESILEIREGYTWKERYNLVKPDWLGSQMSYFAKDWYLFEQAIDDQNYL